MTTLSTNPLNLAVRFVLEITALVAAGMAGWQLFGDVGRWLAVIGIPAAMASMWGTFNVAGDPSRGPAAAGGFSTSGGADESSKGPPVAVPGATRLAVEAIFFGLGVAAFWLIGQETLAIVFGAVVIVHYALSWDRIVWLLQSGTVS